ncbi:MAG: hypothetical protein M3415_08220 [Actinomycetota bacterium]|nr:hypothetical protein [Actinomycetota bacterium]
MIVASLLLVVVAAILLVVGVSRPADLGWVFGSIATCVLAALLLTVGVVRSRPSRRLPPSAPDAGSPWAGATTPPDDERS